MFGPTDPQPGEAERDVGERHAGPCRERGEPEHGDGEQGGDREARDQARDQAPDARDDLGGRDLAKLLLHGSHGGGRLPAE